MDSDSIELMDKITKRNDALTALVEERGNDDEGVRLVRQCAINYLEADAEFLEGLAAYVAEFHDMEKVAKLISRLNKKAEGVRRKLTVIQSVF